MLNWGYMGLSYGEVRLEDYTDDWRVMFEEEAERLRRIFGFKALAIEHVGSTSVSGLVAKPIIDIAVALKSLDDFENFRRTFIEDLNYSVKEDPVPGEQLVRREHDNEVTHFIHVMELDSERYQNTIIFRDALRADDNLRDEYAKLKRKLAEEFVDDRKSYTASKHDFITSVIGKNRA